MLPYLVLTTTAVALAGGADFVRRRGAPGWNPFDVLAVAALVTFSAIRFEVGTDYRTYAYRYEALRGVAWHQIPDTGQEAGFITFQWLLHQVWADPAAVFWATSALTVVPMYAAIRKQSAHGALSVALFILLAYYVTPFNVIRQGVAAALLFWAASFLPSRRRLFVVGAVGASLFHVTAAVAAVALYVTRRWRPTPAQALAAASLAAGVALTVDRIGLLRAGADLLNPRYDAYLGTGEGGIGAVLILAAHAALLVYALIVGGRPTDPRHATWAFIGVLFLVVGTQDVVLGRMALYFTPFLLLLVPNQLAERRDAPVQKMVVLAAASAYFVVYLLHFGGLLPYQTQMTL